MKKLGKVIRGYRILKGLSVKDMAERLGVHSAYYRGLENGQNHITNLMAIRIANILGISYRELKEELSRG